MTTNGIIIQTKTINPCEFLFTFLCFHRSKMQTYHYNFQLLMALLLYLAHPKEYNFAMVLSSFPAAALSTGPSQRQAWSCGLPRPTPFPTALSTHLADAAFSANRSEPRPLLGSSCLHSWTTVRRHVPCLHHLHLLKS